MFVFSNEILEFNQYCHNIIRDILKDISIVSVKTKRFSYKNMTYPIKVLSYIDERELKKNTLAYFCSETLQIQINYEVAKNLSKKELITLLKHELAHYLVYIMHGNVEAHGTEFRNFCKSQNWGEEIHSATISKTKINEDIKRNKNKIQKLMSLSKSDNIHEATLALKKAQSLMFEHNISFEEKKTDSLYYLEVLERFKRKTEKHQSIYSILESMEFALIFHYTNSGCQLETYGNLTQVTNAQEVYNYLNHCLDKIWIKTKEENNLKGLASKNSFFYGFTKGVREQLEQREISTIYKNQLIKHRKDLEIAQSLIYPVTAKQNRKKSLDLYSYKKGILEGKRFNASFKKHQYISN